MISSMYPRPRTEASREEIGCFMFFAWPALLAFLFFHLFFTVVGWLFEQPWFYILGALALIVFLIALVILP